MVQQASQVFYVKDPTSELLKMVAAPSRLCLMKTSMYISCVFCFALSVS